MRTIDPARSALLVVDIQERLMPAIHDRETVVANSARLLKAAELLGVPAIATEQYPKGLGHTVDAVPLNGAEIVEKTEFDVTRNANFARHLPGERPDLVVVGCEAHVCVLQTVLGLLDGKRRVHVVADAIGSRVEANKRAAIERMARHGAEIVTTEMVVFEWLQSADHPRFRETVALIK